MVHFALPPEWQGVVSDKRFALTDQESAVTQVRVLIQEVFCLRSTSYQLAMEPVLAEMKLVIWNTLNKEIDSVISEQHVINIWIWISFLPLSDVETQ